MTDPAPSTQRRPEIEGDPPGAGLDPQQLRRLSAALRAYVEDGRLPGWSLLVSRGGVEAHRETCGRRDLDRRLPVDRDTLFRIYSMTKPITSVAALQLVERGAIALTDPIATFLPAFAEPRVWAGGTPARPGTVPSSEPVRVWHLLTHTAGLTYGFIYNHPVETMYRSAGFEWSVPAGLDLAGAVDAWAALPLLFTPGSEWNYSHATDVLGRLIEVVSGQTLDAYLAQHVFDPLGLSHTSFRVHDAERLATLYTPQPVTGVPTPLPSLGNVALDPSWLSGGGGLVSTIDDYHRFALMLLRGGELDGVRLLGRRTLAAMTTNYLPGDADLAAIGRPLSAEIPFPGTGFGLGFAVTLDPMRSKTFGSPGDFGWGGAASTVFWVDPVEELVVVFLTQLLPSSTYPLRSLLRQLIYPALR